MVITPWCVSQAMRSVSFPSIPAATPAAKKRRGLTMRHVHRAGEKAFVDYAGKTPGLTDPVTGEWRPVELFVIVLGASSYTYAEATRTQQLPDWIASHTRAFAFFGGVPTAVVPDQLKSAVTTACRYEPGVQRLYAELATHYGTTILPARPAKPRDKAKVEVAVQVAERRIVARLRHEVFFTLAALNTAVRAGVTSSSASTGRRCVRSRRRASSTPSGNARASMSITTSPSITMRIPSRTRCARTRPPSRCASPRASSRSFIAANASRCTSVTTAPASRRSRRTHAEGPSTASRLVAVALPPLGHDDRAADRGARRCHPRRSPASRAGLPLVSRHPAARQALRSGTP